MARNVTGVSNPSLFAAPPTINASGELLYTPASNAFGTSTFEVSVQDSGGTSRGGVNTSETQTFTVTVLADVDFGDAPSAYPVAIADDGAGHIIGPLFMGDTVGKMRSFCKRVAVLNDCRIYEFDDLDEAEEFQNNEALAYG